MNLLDILMYATLPVMVVAGEGASAGDGDVVVTTTDGDSPDLTKQTTTTAEEKKEPAKDVPVETQMLEGMKAVLKPVDPAAEKAKAEKAKLDTALADESRMTAGEIEAKRATEAAAKEKSDKEAADKLKAKKPEDLDLTPDEKKNWKQETQRRFGELREAFKARYLENERLTAENAKAIAARDNILDMFDEYKIEPGEDFISLLTYNKAVKTGDLNTALKIVNQARTDILKRMGKEEPGVDLLEEFGDLTGKVENSEMTRDAALEVAHSRRRDADAERQRGEQQRREQEDGAAERSRKDGLTAIGKWTSDLAKTDINFKAKEQKLLAPGKDGLSQLDRVIREYPSNLWVRTLQALYDAVEIVKPPVIPSKEDDPLRPSGAKQGAKVFTELTPDALRAGLGYPSH